MTEIEIDAVYPKRSAYPMLVNFQNGYVTDGFRDIECSLYNNDDNSKKTLVSLLDDIVYTGEEEDEPIGRTLLVARDRNTGKVRIIEPGYVELKPVIKNDLNSSQLLETSGLELSRKFGSKKQKKKMEQREKLKMNVETVAKQVEKTTANISVDQLDLSAYNNASVGDDFYIPPINREASCVEDIYSIEKIISNDIMEAIESEIEGKDLSEDIHPSIQSIIDKNPKKTLQTVFGLYASCLAKYYTTVMRDVNRKNFYVCNSSRTLNNFILENFSTKLNGKRGRPGEYKDRAFCHSLVLLLLINNFKISVDKFCEITKASPKIVLTKCRVTGVTVLQQGGEKVLQLKLPLPVKKVFKRKQQ